MSPISYRILKITVVVMGVLLFSGMSLVLFTIIYRAVNSDAVDLQNMDQSVFRSYTTDVSVPVGAVVGSVILSDDILLLQIESPSGISLLLYDVQSARMRGKINLVEE